MRITSITAISLLVFMLAACSAIQPDSTKTSVQEQASPPASGMGSFFAIDEVGLGSDGYITLTNFTDVPASTKGLYICQGSDCFALPDAVIQPGSTGRITVGDGKELDEVVATRATIGELKPADGEVALFASDKFNDPKALLVYLQWGSTPHALTGFAVEAGLWIEKAFAPSSENASRLYRVEDSGLWLFEEPKP